jgi:hypothetical protein
MPRSGPDPRGGLRPFSISGYEILDDEFRVTGEVEIWSRSLLPLRVGERLNIETAGELNELEVAEVRTFTGGWAAICRREAP